MTAEQLNSSDMEFWPLEKVLDKVGLSKSEVYRQIGEQRFPAGRAYRNSSRRFWLSTEVRAWQLAELTGQDVAPATDLAGLIG